MSFHQPAKNPRVAETLRHITEGADTIAEIALRENEGEASLAGVNKRVAFLQKNGVVRKEGGRRGKGGAAKIAPDWVGWARSITSQAFGRKRVFTLDEQRFIDQAKDDAKAYAELTEEKVRAFKQRSHEATSKVLEWYVRRLFEKKRKGEEYTLTGIEREFVWFVGTVGLTLEGQRLFVQLSGDGPAFTAFLGRASLKVSDSLASRESPYAFSKFGTELDVDPSFRLIARFER